ncbi:MULTISPECIES: c-type cytochrome [Chitinophagaceae]
MKKLIGIFILTIAMAYNVHAQDAAAGQAIFSQNCTSCHAVGKQVVGPDLMNVDQLRSQDWIINFVHSSQTVIKSGDTAAVRLYGEFNKTLMPDHPQLSKEDIINIIAYIKDASAKMKDAPKGAGNLPAAPPMYVNSNGSSFIHKLIFLDVNGDFHPMELSNYFFWISLALMLVALVAGLLAAVRLQDVKHQQKDQE